MMTDVAMLIDGIEGWCTVHKATKLFELAAAADCNLAVEIGIYGGKSLLPVAAAFEAKKRGVIYGIEPWDNAVAVETQTGDQNDKWWSEIDLMAIKRAFLQKILDEKLEAFVKILEVPSDAALSVLSTSRFNGRIDLIHIDGSHSIEQSLFDCACWLRLVRPGGCIVLDDINWPTVSLALKFLQGASAQIYHCDTEGEGHFAIFRKRI